LRNVDIHKALWVVGAWDTLKTAANLTSCTVATDKFEDPVLLFKNKWDLSKFKELYPDIHLSKVDPSTGPVSEAY
jgi:peptide subunit release factor RF-3